ncbi:MAG TPA: hypothetical protein VGI39_02075 [Polyangiaceae bacterium]|jgi:hypothetical protein
MPSPLARLGAWLDSKRARLGIPMVGVALALPSIAGGLVFDDLAMRSRVHGATGADFASRFDLFAFFPGDVAGRARLHDLGFLPWFASPKLQISFLRPLSALSHFVDYTLFDRWPWWMHLESLALYAALLFVAGALYRRFLPAAVAPLAALLYALDYGHGIPVGWLANRNALIAGTLALLALGAHDRWRREGWRAGAVVGPAVFGLALLGGESAVGVLGFLLAHAMTLDRAPTKRRLAAVAPYLIVFAVWHAVYRALGYGAHGSGAYLDPVFQPAAFVTELPRRAIALLTSQVGPPPASLYPALPRGAQWPLILAEAAVLTLLVRLLAARVRASPELRFFALGALLALPPATMAFSDNRLLILVGWGVFPIVASVIGDLSVAAPLPRALRGLRRFWLVHYLVISPLLLTFSAVFLPLVARLVRPLDLGPGLAKQTVVLTHVPTLLTAVPWVFTDDVSRTAPARVRVLLSTLGSVAVRREDPHTVVLSLGDDSTPDPTTLLFRERDRRFEVGEVLPVPGLRAEVLRVDDDGAAREVRFHFDRPLDDPAYRWIGYEGGRFTELPVPR